MILHAVSTGKITAVATQLLVFKYNYNYVAEAGSAKPGKPEALIKTKRDKDDHCGDVFQVVAITI